jgi:hypothetical protein
MREWQVPGVGWGCTRVPAFQFQVMDSAIAGSARTEMGCVVVVRGLQGLTHSTLVWSKLAHSCSSPLGCLTRQHWRFSMGMEEGFR